MVTDTAPLARNSNLSSIQSQINSNIIAIKKLLHKYRFRTKIATFDGTDRFQVREDLSVAVKALDRSVSKLHLKESVEILVGVMESTELYAYE
jgi:hypothetical protein